ncbi:MAG: sigma-70 family RNA polymerase sigma factor [Phycisphaerales bacterium]|nr:sigma-70 family RNA polymerase sigma factor [Phycisphaerales bacterium]
MLAEINAQELAAIRRAVAGDLDAFRILVESHQTAVFRFAAAILRDAHAAEDIAQETFLTAFRNLARFDPARAAFATWLLAIARNLALNILQKQKQKPYSTLLADPPETAIASEPEENLAQAEWRRRLDEALDQLPPSQKTAFILAEFLELPCEQIARIEETQPSTVRANLTRARERLRSLLHEFSGGYR